MVSKLIASIIIITLVVLLSLAISAVIQLAFPNSNFPSHHVLIITSLLLPISVMSKDWRIATINGVLIGGMIAYRYFGNYHSIVEIIGGLVIAMFSTLTVTGLLVLAGRKMGIIDKT